MIPADTNRTLAIFHLDVLFANLPGRIIEIGKKSATVLLEERLRKALMYVQINKYPLLQRYMLKVAYRFPDPPARYHNIVSWALRTRMLIIRYLFLPRPEFLRKEFIPSAPDSMTGRFNSVEYLSYPWYVKPTLSRRWGPKSWMTRLLGRKLPGDDGNQYAPEGYTFAEIGPNAQSGKGVKEMEDTCARLTRTRGGCPF